MTDDLALAYSFQISERSYRLVPTSSGVWDMLVNEVPVERMRSRDDVLAAALSHAAQFGSERSDAYNRMRRIENWRTETVDLFSPEKD